MTDVSSPQAVPAISCSVCSTALRSPVYRSLADVSVTSLCEIQAIPTHVFFCEACGHVQTTQLADIDRYYDVDYKILIADEEEDQLYQLESGKRIFRSEHQAHTLLQKLPLRHGARVLDYGCAKASTMRHLQKARPDLKLHLFDVSSMYIPFWTRFLEPSQWATYEPKAEWRGSFDAVTAFFSLEHVASPRSYMASVAGLLAPEGIYYGIVPDWTANPADFVVVDHVNHFSVESLSRLMDDAGLKVLEIDARSHASALIVTARKSAAPALSKPNLQTLSRKVAETASYWTDFRDRVRAFERQHPASAAIYGSGFYGTFIASCLSNLAEVSCFLDQDPFRQGKTLVNKQILAPEALPASVRAVYVGLNPAIARREMAKVEAWQDRRLTYFFG